MGVRKSSVSSEETTKYLLLFREGKSKGMDYVYRNSFHNLTYFGKELLNDEFTVSCLLHECYLKAWNQRQRLESLPHIYRFIRLNLRWQILRHIEKSRHSIYGQTPLSDQMENTIGDFDDPIEEKESTEEDHKKLRMATESIKYLSAESQQIISLHFQKGLTYKQIGERLGKSSFQVSNQINKSVKQIKNMVHIASKSSEKNSALVNKAHEGILDSEQSIIYQLRKQQKLSFCDIAEKLGVSQLQVQQQYIQAHQLLRHQAKQKRANQFSHV
ncbi:sigma-70 family RNA polymerase sigma factor [Dyadobacter subterraneus]|uniref:Sigma-70 family RNA polymerase sigma factor n=1 Tax=Dyadobacter subterraneus TaxID=2773304 RepID=A0ABR9WEA3_9BACT|nr:sigma-70 family RNA polymerase sigma factor [Dyadobacter subterraneus]MBE9463757.1 sigma-70 family RNA polymerase sigma factor [Dyadobacter subterraneus]